jgi:hypothetical protein
MKAHDFKPMFAHCFAHPFGIRLGYVTRVFLECEGRDLQSVVSGLRDMTAGILE